MGERMSGARAICDVREVSALTFVLTDHDQATLQSCSFVARKTKSASPCPSPRRSEGECSPSYYSGSVVPPQVAHCILSRTKGGDTGVHEGLLDA